MSHKLKLTILSKIYLVFFFSLVTKSQDERILDSNYIRAYENIKNLKEGVLLVRLKTNENTINLLKEKGNIELAAKYEQKQKEENTLIVHAFRNYTFSKVFFFYSTHTKKIKQLDFSNVLDSSFSKVDPVNWTYKKNQVFTAEFSELTNENFGFPVFIIMDNEFNYIKKPFPYYIRTFQTLFFLRKKKEQTIKEIDNKLNKFYLSSLPK